MSYLYTKINESMFINAFIAYGRKDNFTDTGLKALFNHLEQLAEECEAPIEFDVIALCCEFAEVSPGEEYDEDTIIAELDNGNLLINHR